MNIVRVLFDEFLQVADKVLGLLEGEWDYPTFVEHVERVLNDLGKKLCREALEAADDWLKDNPKEREGWTVVRRDPKSLLTPFGEIHYQRRYYRNRKTGTYAYLLDQAIGVTPHGRIDPLVKTRLVDEATDVSYRKAGKQGTSPEDTVSGQTVMNVIRETFLTASPTISRNGRRMQTRYLHVQADEDHIKKQDGGLALAKLVYTTDGYGRDWGERRVLNNVHYTAGVYRDNEVLYQEVYENIEGNYDIDSIEKIYVYGDGAPWIRGLAEYLGAVFLLDKYHINKCITESLGFCPELRSALLQAVKAFDLKAVKSILGKARKAAMTESEKQRVAQCRRYLISNWDGIIAWKEEAPTS
ncbi:MAG TPA: ISLre2 family transposase [Firmicutes bacterium]|nr:ISLre2 family transposase [Bacillota bacterium]